MTIQKSLLGLVVFAALSAGPCVLAAVAEDNSVGITETRIKFAECPASVQETFRQESLGGKINAVVVGIDDGQKIYKAYVTLDAREYQIVVYEHGELLAKELKDDGEIITDVEFSDCPVAVQKTLKRESRGAAIKLVIKVVSDEKTEYSVEPLIDGRIYRVIVAESGVLIWKKRGASAQLLN